MSGVIYQQIPIRLQLSTASSPPVAPVDANTGQTPQFFRGQSLAIQVAVFDAQNNPVDISNLASLNLAIQPAYDSPYPSVTSVVEEGDFENSSVPWNVWNSGDGCQVEFDLSPLFTDLPLGGQAYVDYWITVMGLTSGGAVFAYGAGNIRVYNPGASLPFPIPLYTSFHQQGSSSRGGSNVVAPTSPVHTEEIDYTGAAGANSVVVNPVGQQQGAQCSILLTWPAGVAGVVVYVYNQATSNPALTSFYSPGDGVTKNATIELVLNAGAWQLVRAQQPAF